MEGQKDMEEPAKGKASGENLQAKRGTMRGATRSGGGQSGLIIVLVVSFLVSISQVNVPAGFLTSGLAVTLGAGQTATFSVVVAPTSSGSVTGNANVVSNASSPVTIPLAGTGGQPTAYWTTSTWDLS